MKEINKLWNHLDVEEGTKVSHTLPKTINTDALFNELQVLDAQSHQYEEIALTISTQGFYNPGRNLHGTICDLIKELIDLRDQVSDLQGELDCRSSRCEECGVYL